MILSAKSKDWQNQAKPMKCIPALRTWKGTKLATTFFSANSLVFLVFWAIFHLLRLGSLPRLAVVCCLSVLEFIPTIHQSIHPCCEIRFRYATWPLHLSKQFGINLIGLAHPPPAFWNHQPSSSLPSTRRSIGCSRKA